MRIRVLERMLGMVILTALMACGSPPDDPEADPRLQGVSLLGEPLYSKEDDTGAIERADTALAAAPDDLDRIIDAGRVRRNFWQYRDAIDLYTRAIELAPGDWQAYRYRGHRYISTRRFPQAILDLEAARERAPLNWDVAYHLGLAYFLSGRFGDAADEYNRCLVLADDPAAEKAHSDNFRSCSQNRSDPESLVAMTEWAVRAASRAGQASEVAALLANISADLVIEENIAYLHNLLLSKGLKTEEELLNPGPDPPYRRETVGFGVAHRRLVGGDETGALELFEELAKDPWWPGFGRIAAEVEVHRAQGQQ